MARGLRKSLFGFDKNRKSNIVVAFVFHELFKTSELSLNFYSLSLFDEDICAYLHRFFCLLT